ncbi:lysophospholipase [Sphingomonas yunnanensis]|uniref:alpha/beta hydrolase family protein n=1 Tax=Sphingomonas yunnanensis TaxID=310400 RepID=UPI001CA73D64|nr:alpha/beta fold hydrolase [Sphingomonas yunnanensis]MBY9061898.1 lysophospholipase [Sphingomonas yunnanensis]
MRLLAVALAVCMTWEAPVVTAQTTALPEWAVPTDYPVEQRAIVFENRGARLAGTLFIPTGTKPRAAVIALHGAQVPLRSDPLYRHLTEALPRLGIAVLLYDRRGSGASTSGGAAPGNFDLLADDAVAAFARLSGERDIDPRRIGFWGLSQGGWLTILAARKEQRAAFAVAVSGPIAAADVQMNYAVSNILRIQGKPQAVVDRAIAARTAVDDYVRGKGARASAERAEAGIRSEPWYADTWIKGNIDDPEWRQQIGNDPMRALVGSRVPTLVMFGQADPWVPVAASLAALRAHSAELPQVTVRVIDGADHAMMLGVPPARQVDAQFATLAAPDAPAYFALLGAWLQKTINP